MIPQVQTEEETKTIKYLNQQVLGALESQSNSTERHYEDHSSGSNPHSFVHGHNYFEQGHPAHRVIIVEKLEHDVQSHEVRHNMVHSSRPKHKKGKSMDYEEYGTSNQQGKHSKTCNVKEKGKIAINADFITELRSKNNTDMKVYNVSKKLTAYRKQREEANHPVKRKKAKSVNEGDIKEIKKQIKSIMETTPLTAKNRKKEQIRQPKGKKLSKVSSPASVVYRGHSKSVDFCTERKAKSVHRERRVPKSNNQLKSIAFTMPITTKMVSLYSNTSSVYSSRNQLEPMWKEKGHVIPTDESVAELPEIKMYESAGISRKNSGSLRNFRKYSFMQELETQNLEPLASTRQLINNFIIPSQDATHSSLNIRSEQAASEQGSSQSFQPPDIDVANYRLQSSEVIHQLSKQQSQKEQSSPLNDLIMMINEKGQNSQSDTAKALLQRIKDMMPKKEQQARNFNEKDNSALQRLELSQHSLKDSTVSDDNLGLLNLDLLDNALRQRQQYLVQRREKELAKLEERREQGQEVDGQYEMAEKWANFQLREVRHTRNQLWKGLNNARSLLQEDERSNTKTKEMMKCLSDKYIYQNRHKREPKSHSPDQQESHERNELVRSPLAEGRVTLDVPEVRVRSGSVTSGININYDSEESEIPSEEPSNEQKLLDSEMKNSLEFREHAKRQNAEENDDPKASQFLKKKIEIKSSYEESGAGAGNNELQQAIFDVKMIECEDIEYENSFNEEDIQRMEREAELRQEQQHKQKSLFPTHLALQDKEDIFEFIFLDLCIELTDQYSLESHIMQSIATFIRRMKDQATKQKGFKTNSSAVKDCLYQFVSFLKNNTDLLEEVHKNLENPLGPTAKDILKYMHVYDDDPVEEDSSESVFIMDIKVFEQFQKFYLDTVEINQYYEDEEKEKKRRVFLKNAIHIHNKAIFDAMNETLDRQRPYGVWGQPFPWKRAPKFSLNRNTVAKNNTILKSAQKTIEYCAYMCGFMVQKEDCNLKNNPNITAGYIEQVRDDRLSRMLATELQESEEKMLFIDDEQTEILVEMGNFVVQQLLAQAARDLNMMHSYE